ATTGKVVAGTSTGPHLSGAAPLGNGCPAVPVSKGTPGNWIGGPSAWARNSISANGSQGIQISDTGTSAGGLTLTSAAIVAGFRLSTFATNFPFFNTSTGGFVPAGFAFPASGGVLVSAGPGDMRLFPT